MVWARSGEGLGRGEAWVGGRAEPVQAGKRTSSAVRSHVAPNRPSRSAAPLTALAPSRDRPTRLYPRLYFGFTRREWRNLADAPDLGAAASRPTKRTPSAQMVLRRASASSPEMEGSE